MIRAPKSAPARRSFSFDGPVFQWDARHGLGPLVVRLFGRLGPRELSQMILAIRERGRSPRDLVCLDFEQARWQWRQYVPYFRFLGQSN